MNVHRFFKQHAICHSPQHFALTLLPQTRLTAAAAGHFSYWSSEYLLRNPKQSLTTRSAALRRRIDLPQFLFKGNNLNLFCGRWGGGDSTSLNLKWWTDKKWSSTFSYKEQDVMSPESRRMLDTATEYQKQGKFKEAVVLYDQLINRYPHVTGLLAQKAHALEGDGQYREAIKWYRTVLFHVPNNMPSLERIALCFKALGEVEEALLTYDQLLYVDPTYVSGIIGKADILYSQGKLDDALLLYKNATQIDGTNVHALLSISGVMILKGDMQKAITTYEKILKIEPDCKEAHAGVGIISYINKNYAAALSSFSAALKKDKDNADLLVKRSSCYAKLNRCEAALEDVQRALQIEPSLELALMIRGDLWLHFKKYKNAIADFAAFIKGSHYQNLEQLPAHEIISRRLQKAELLYKKADAHMNLFFEKYPSLASLFPFDTTTPAPTKPPPPASSSTEEITEDWIQDLHHRLKIAKADALLAAFLDYLEVRTSFKDVNTAIDPKLRNLKKVVNAVLREH